MFCLGLPASWPLLMLGWTMAFLAVFIGAEILFGSLAGAFAGDFPYWEMVLAISLSLIVLDLPIRVLWRVPCHAEGAPGDK